MSNSLREQIHENMALKETGELLEVWRGNDHVEWSDEAFEVIKQILEERGADIPEQNEPVYEHKEDEKNVEDYDFSDEELRIINDENPPDFYDPFDVLLTTKRIDWIAKAMVAFTIAYNILHYPGTLQIARSYFIRNPGSPLVYVFTVLLIVVNTVIGAVVIYFPLKILARILRILMEMEFRSRKEI